MNESLFPSSLAQELLQERVRKCEEAPCHPLGFAAAETYWRLGGRGRFSEKVS